MIIVLDTETTGFPIFGKSYRDLWAFKKGRLTELAFLVVNDDFKIEEKYSNFIIPEGFDPDTLPGIEVSGITTEMCKGGVKVKEAIKALKNAIDKYKPNYIVAHNYAFDSYILDSEAFRLGIELGLTDSKQKYCTMMKGMEMFELKKRPKLDELYLKSVGKERKKAHRAYIDARDAARCLKRMLNSKEN